MYLIFPNLSRICNSLVHSDRRSSSLRVHPLAPVVRRLQVVMQRSETMRRMMIYMRDQRYEMYNACERSVVSLFTTFLFPFSNLVNFEFY